MPALTPANNYDAVVVGSGFAGMYEIHRLREMGLSVKGLDKAGDVGGVWWWNCYPGARVDSYVPMYQLFLEDTYKDWTWSEKFPDRNELFNYFKHVDQKLHVSDYISFNTTVTAAEFNQDTNFWKIITEGDGAGTYHARYFILCTGFAAKAYIPNIKGIDKFKGFACHTALWPQNGVDYKGKRVGVIGTGCSGVQVIQEISGDVRSMSVFQRTPNIALPMQQTKLDAEFQNLEKPTYPEMYKNFHTSHSGFSYNNDPRSALNVTEADRNAHFEKCFNLGGFHYILGNFYDIVTDRDANKYAYDFWRDKTLQRIKKPENREKLAPKIPPHPFTAKRASLEMRYYEVLNQPNVDL
ncbi:uncharacterized protein V1518DRAFT_188259, partial [Limtongia smithiae]|uniref:uncharacterized protein n=1 Tax=Limtongia smithiae TaxID=1125753 RepID=UPI0034CDB32C